MIIHYAIFDHYFLDPLKYFSSILSFHLFGDFTVITKQMITIIFIPYSDRKQRYVCFQFITNCHSDSPVYSIFVYKNYVSEKIGFLHLIILIGTSSICLEYSTFLGGVIITVQLSFEEV